MNHFALDTAGDEYRQKRETLRQAEIALKEQVETVARLRRELPAATPVPHDYEFVGMTGSEPGAIRLSQLFSADDKPLLVYHFMWAPDADDPCPMCTMWTDGYNAVAPHIDRNATSVLITKQDAAVTRQFAQRRGWSNLRILSSGGTSFNRDFGMETPDGRQLPGLSVFLKGNDGKAHHFYTTSALMGDEHYRGMDLFTPVWNLLDLLPQGRGNFMPLVSYD